MHTVAHVVPGRHIAHSWVEVNTEHVRVVAAVLLGASLEAAAASTLAGTVLLSRVPRAWTATSVRWLGYKEIIKGKKAASRRPSAKKGKRKDPML